MIININKKLKALHSIFKTQGFELYAVGGAVRDKVLGFETNDIDFCTNATPKEMLSFFPYAIKTGIKHGTLTIPFKGEHFEITTYRLDGEYKDNRHPETVTFSSDLRDDLSRRDFTINAMALDLETGEVIDPWGGMDDLKKRLIRAVGEPIDRFKEDALRILRAIRFSAKLGFDIDRATIEGMKKNKANISSISKERINTEFYKTITSPFVNKGLSFLKELDLFTYIAPLLGPLNENSLNLSYEKSPLLVPRLSSLFYTLTDDKAKVIKTMKELKSSNKEINDTSAIFENLYVDLSSLKTPYEKRLFLSRLKREYFEDYFTTLLILKKDDGSLKKEYSKYLKDPLTLKELSVNGNHLKELGFEAREIGRILDKCLDKVLSDPTLNKTDILLKEI